MKDSEFLGIVGASVIVIVCSFILGYCTGYQHSEEAERVKAEQAEREQERVTIDNLNARIRVLEQDHREGVK